MSEQALKTPFSLDTLFDKLSLELSEKLKLFDYIILFILSYGLEIWGLHNAPDSFHRDFFKLLLGVRQ